MNNRYVQEYSKIETTHWWFCVRRDIIMQVLRRYVQKDRTLHILNIGIAGGASSKWLSELGNVTSVENDPLFLEYLSSQHLPVTNASITDLPFADDSFDLVCAFDVIEHVEDDTKAVDEMFRVCKPNGKICVTVPAFHMLWGTHDEINGHKRRYVYSSLKKLFQGKQNRLLYRTYFNSFLFLPIFLLRKIAGLFTKKNADTDSDFSYFKQNSFLNKILKVIFGIEVGLLRFMKFPFGVSLLFLSEKTGAIHDGNE
jgi:SAM-dependent methyltransferase